MEKEKNYYQLLGISRNFSNEELLEAVTSKIALIKYKLDGNDEKIEQFIDRVLDIFNTLSDEKKRKKYNQTLYVQALSRKEQLEASAQQRKDDTYVIMNNPPAFKLKNNDGETIVSGYKLIEHNSYVKRPYRRRNLK